MSEGSPVLSFTQRAVCDVTFLVSYRVTYVSSLAAFLSHRECFGRNSSPFARSRDTEPL